MVEYMIFPSYLIILFNSLVMDLVVIIVLVMVVWSVISIIELDWSGHDCEPIPEF